MAQMEPKTAPASIENSQDLEVIVPALPVKRKRRNRSRLRSLNIPGVAPAPPAESDLQRAAFHHYLLLGTNGNQRSITAVAEHFMVNPDTLIEWSVKFRWHERAKEYDSRPEFDRAKETAIRNILVTAELDGLKLAECIVPDPDNPGGVMLEKGKVTPNSLKDHATVNYTLARALNEVDNAGSGSEGGGRRGKGAVNVNVIINGA